MFGLQLIVRKRIMRNWKFILYCPNERSQLAGWFSVEQGIFVRLRHILPRKSGSRYIYTYVIMIIGSKGYKSS